MKCRNWQRFEVAGLALLVWVATVNVSAQVLNPGFEITGTNSSQAANWTVGQAVGGPVYAVRTNENPHSGSFHYRVHLASTGAGPVVEFSQPGVPVTGGAVVPFTFYASALTGSAGHNAQWRILWNQGGDTGFRGFNPGNNTYALITNSVTAPPAATSATISFYIAGAASASLSANIDIDDVSLGGTNVITDPGDGSTNRFQINLVRGTGISWFATNNVSFQVQWASNLNSGTVWHNLGNPILGNGSSNAVFDPSGPPHNHYQVLSIQ